MTALVQINQGTAPAGTDGDTVRAAFTKVNGNTAVLQGQAALVSGPTITTPQALTVAHVGKRININLSTAGTVNLPAASTCAADSVILLRNTGTTVVNLAITTGSGDSVVVSRLNAGEALLTDSDGVHTWGSLMRGRTNSDNETVNGNCAVGGNETVAGTLTVTGATALATLTTAGAITSQYATPTYYLNDTSQSGGAGRYRILSTSGSLVFQRNTASAGDYSTVSAPLTFSGADVAAFSQRPTFASKTPWDTGNLPSPATVDTTQTLTGQKTFTNYVTSTFAPGSAVGNCNYNINGLGGLANIGFASVNATASIILRCSSASVLEVTNGASNGYNSITCASVTQTSDKDLKANVTNVRSVLPLLRTKRVVNYSLKVPMSEGGGEGAPHIGVIAQEWQDDFPELVVETGTEIDADGDFIAHQYDEDGNEIYGVKGKPVSRKALGFNYSNASAVALQAIIELDAALQAALARIAALEGKQ